MQTGRTIRTQGLKQAPAVHSAIPSRISAHTSRDSSSSGHVHNSTHQSSTNASSQAAGSGLRNSALRNLGIARAVAFSTTTFVEKKQFTISKGARLNVEVHSEEDGSQVATFRTDIQAGKLLLHWGVEGGKNYKGGWRLPQSQARPEGTVQYKDRALQTPFKHAGSELELIIRLPPDEASNVMNFVLKDEMTNTWFDNSGTNFRVLLRSDGEDSSAESDTEGGSDNGVVMLKNIPDLPKELCDKWAWVKWDHVGRPNRSHQEALHEYDLAIQEMQVLLRRGRPLDELWRVVSGQITYADYKRKTIDPVMSTTPAHRMPAAPAPPTPTPKVTPPPPPPAPKRAEAPAPTSMGSSMNNTGKRNPMDLVKRSKAPAPVLSQDKRVREVRPLDFLVERFAVDPALKWRRTFQLESKAEMLAIVRQNSDTDPVQVDLITDCSNKVVLHWGITRPGSKDWKSAPDTIWPEDTQVTGKAAADTRFLNCNDDECEIEVMEARVPLQRVRIIIPANENIGGLTFVLRSEDATMWYKDAGGNFFVPVPNKAEAMPDPADLVTNPICSEIVEAESSSAWTLMHRFNKAASLIQDVMNGNREVSTADAFSAIYIWLRYSATRQLTWQRNYNTQPRILSAAQDRLTNAVAEAHGCSSGEAQEWVRLMLTTVGRGGNGQAIRDEILNIMHRNKIKEVKGTWMEEWHQKLHNNTTPDDVPICEAYLEYLESNGNLQAYWRKLADAGLTRERLEGYDRAIVTQPEFYADKKQDLIRDFRNYLGILKAVHSGADLQASASAAGNRIPNGAQGYLGYVLTHMADSQVLPMIEAAVEARTELSSAVTGNRELLYLDLALEEQVRRVAERGVGSAGFGAAALMRPLLQNLALSLGNNEEVCFCLKAWLELPASVKNGGRPSKEEALLAVAVVNRIRRAISDISDSIMNRIAAPSKQMGNALRCERWAVDLFPEEVIRGGPAFAVSLVISSIEPTLRKAAALGAWQVISPQEVTGVVEAVTGLHEVQEKLYDVPTVLVAQHVSGEEEIPEGVVAVLTPDAPDVLSHVSVRARNMRVLFATCHDQQPLQQIMGYAGKYLHFKTTAAGAVTWSESNGPAAQAAASAAQAEKPHAHLKIDTPEWCGKWAIGMDEYKDGVVGAKSKNLAKLRGKLPNWINLPSSVTLPFGCFEQVLELPENASIKSKLSTIVANLVQKKLGSTGAHSAAELLAECRHLAMKVTIPAAVQKDLGEVMKAAGIPVPANADRWAAAMHALKGVWASKYNDRAYYSMRKVGLNFDDVRMAVLVQRVVPAQYAFVIHTKNPSNNNENEVFCELVKGLGESLVSGMVPGSSVAFVANKNNLENPEVLCYASKSEGMFVPETLIFRSDSNGEDLEGYAGAGLYESITMDATKTVKIDYMDDKLVQDVGYRRHVMSQICTVGSSIETALGSAQDIEGVVAPDGSITVVQTRPQV